MVRLLWKLNVKANVLIFFDTKVRSTLGTIIQHNRL